VAFFKRPRLLLYALLCRARGKGVAELKRYLTIKELAEELHICRASVYNYLKTIPGFPQPMKVGRLSRWNGEEVESFMNRAPRGVYGENNGRAANE
jgi:predicted DNA-binding transcriptional regulator AlpA